VEGAAQLNGPSVLGRNLRRWRHENRLCLKQVAGDLGVSESIVSAWERGARFPSGEHLEAISKHTGIPPCLLFCCRNGKCPYSRLRRRVIGADAVPPQPAAIHIVQKKPVG